MGADVSRLTQSKDVMEPPYVGCYELLIHTNVPTGSRS